MLDEQPQIPPVSAPPSTAGRTAALVIGIAVGALVVIGGLAVAVFFLASSLFTTFESVQPEASGGQSEEAELPPSIEQLPLEEGSAASPTAAKPLACNEQCFTQGTLGATVPTDASMDELGVPMVESSFGDYERSSPSTEYTIASRTWIEQEGEPDECFFTYSGVPLAVDLDERPATSTDAIHFMGYRYSEDEYSGLDMTTRLFANTTSAEAHMQSVVDHVAGCTNYDIGDGATFWTADVTPAPGLTLPASVAAVGWVEDSPFGRFYVIDLQRGNLVYRAVLSTDGAITESAFRSFMEGLAVHLDGLPV